VIGGISPVDEGHVNGRAKGTNEKNGYGFKDKNKDTQ
jgi:hypothetical protein